MIDTETMSRKRLEMTSFDINSLRQLVRRFEDDNTSLAREAAMFLKRKHKGIF